MRIAVGSDLAGKPLLDVIEAHLENRSDLTVENIAQEGSYADIAMTVATAVMEGKYDRGILCCGTGIGVNIAARPSGRQNPITRR